MTRLYHVANLRSSLESVANLPEVSGPASVAEVDPAVVAEVFESPWRSLRLLELEPGSRLGPRDVGAAEVFIHVTSGSGVARFDSGDVDLVPGRTLLVLARGSLELENTSGSGSLEVFLTEIATPAG